MSKQVQAERVLLLAGGGKGGVGKSFFQRTCLQYHLAKAIPYTLIESDRSNPDCLRSYGKDGKAQVAVLSEGSKYEDSANILLNSALEGRTLVNLPAQVFNPLRQWFWQNSIHELSRELGVEIYHFFVSDCGYDSLSLFAKYVHEFGSHVNHVFVKNYGMTDDWEPFESDDTLQELIQTYQIPVIALPKFIGNKDRNQIDKLSLTFGEASVYEEFGPISRQRVKTYLRKAFAELERLPILNPHQSTAEPSRSQPRSIQRKRGRV